MAQFPKGQKGNMALNTGVVIVSAGQGKRLGRPDKAALNLDGTPLFSRSLKVFAGIKEIKEIVLVLAKSNFSLAKKFIKGGNITLAEGGKRRADSVFKGLEALSKDIDYVLIHDGARPFVSKRLILNLLRELKRHPAVICGVRCSDTLKLAKQGFIKKTLDRDEVYLVQTPQGFRKKLIFNAYQKFRKKSFTDDAQILEAVGKRVKIIEGDILNFKITYPQDLYLAKIISHERL